VRIFPYPAPMMERITRPFILRAAKPLLVAQEALLFVLQELEARLPRGMLEIAERGEAAARAPVGNGLVVHHTISHRHLVKMITQPSPRQALSFGLGRT